MAGAGGMRGREGERAWTRGAWSAPEGGRVRRARAGLCTESANSPGEGTRGAGRAGPCQERSKCLWALLRVAGGLGFTREGPQSLMEEACVPRGLHGAAPTEVAKARPGLLGHRPRPPLSAARCVRSWPGGVGRAAKTERTLGAESGISRPMQTRGFALFHSDVPHSFNNNKNLCNSHGRCFLLELSLLL